LYIVPAQIFRRSPLVDKHPQTQKAFPQQKCKNIYSPSVKLFAERWFDNMVASVSCCLRLPGHMCEPVRVYGDKLRMLASYAAFDPLCQSHINGPLEAEITYLCKDDLVSHLANHIDQDRLKDFDGLLVELENLQAEWAALLNDDEDPTRDPPAALEYGPDGDWFQASSDRELLLSSSPRAASESAFKSKYGYDSDPFEDPSDTESTSSKSSEEEVGQSSDTMDHAPDGDPLGDFFDIEIPSLTGQTGEGRESFRARFPLLSSGGRSHAEQKALEEEERSFLSRYPSISLVSKSPRLRHDYHRIPSPSRIPVCPSGADCFSCKKCEDAVELEW
jgi:hypothetical protein